MLQPLPMVKHGGGVLHGFVVPVHMLSEVQRGASRHLSELVQGCPPPARQSGSAQSVTPLPVLSMPSPQLVSTVTMPQPPASGRQIIGLTPHALFTQAAKSWQSVLPLPASAVVVVPIS